VKERPAAHEPGHGGDIHRVAAVVSRIDGARLREQRLACGRESGEADALVRLVRGVDPHRSGSEALAERGHAEGGARTDRRFQCDLVGHLVAQHGLPDRHAIGEVAHIPQEVGAIGGEARGDHVRNERVGVVLDDVDDVDAHRPGQRFLTAAHRAPVDVVDANEDGAGRGQIHLRHEHVMRKRDGHPSQRAAGRHGAEDVTALSGDGIRDRTRLPVDGLQLFGTSRGGSRQRAAVGAEDRGHAVFVHQRVNRGARCLWRGGVDDLEPHACLQRAARLRDLERGPEWQSSLERVDVARGVEVRTFAGHRREASFRVTAQDRPDRFAIESRTGPVSALASFSFAPVEAGTRVDFRLEVELDGALRLAAAMMRGRMAREARQNLERLSELLEA